MINLDKYGSASLIGTFRCLARGKKCQRTGCADCFGSRPSVALLNKMPLAQNSASAGDLCSTYGGAPTLLLRPRSFTSPKQSLHRNSASLSARASATVFTFQKGS